MVDWTLRLLGIGGVAALFTGGSFSAASLADYESRISALANTLFRMTSTDAMTALVVAGLALLCAALALFYA